MKIVVVFLLMGCLLLNNTAVQAVEPFDNNFKMADQVFEKKNEIINEEIEDKFQKSKEWFEEQADFFDDIIKDKTAKFRDEIAGFLAGMKTKINELINRFRDTYTTQI